MPSYRTRDDGVAVISAGPYVNHCTLLQTDDYASTLSLNFLQAWCSFWHPTNSVEALKANKTLHTYMRGRGTSFPLLSPLVRSFPHLLLFLIFCIFPFLIRFMYFLLLSNPSLSTRIVPLRFQAGCHRRRPTEPRFSLLCLLCVIYIA